MIAAALISALTVCEPGAVARTAAEAVDAFMAAYNARDLAAAEAVISPGARIGLGAGLQMTGADLIGNYRTHIFLTEPAYVMRPLQQLAVGDTVAQTEAFTGGPQGTFTGLTVYRVKDGCIVEMSVNT
ncbi:MAG TPA: nuclear transport factor 2 family protein [Brevundimonas sp.]|jgi:hypothetical protein|uniref:nuclear transport factor 2 family protein n=1 Tax=Brevundimonas sp. TaxID=1871086 RepID=UPI002DE6D1D9|nr:nuclear transport factor 2 family protein [Brevundimonas sp.]